MNDLTPTSSSTPAKPTSPVLSEELTALLDDPGNPDAAVAKIAWLPALVAEAKRSLPALKAVAEAKAGREGIKAVIGRRLALYPQPQRTEAEWDAWWADYFDVLEDVPLACLEAGMRAYVAMPDSEFMPKPGRLRELAFLTPSRSLTRYHRASQAIERAEYVPPKIPELTPEQIAAEEARREANRRAIAEMAKDFTAKAIPSPLTRRPMPYTGGVADETGITPQMREVMHKQRQA